MNPRVGRLLLPITGLAVAAMLVTACANEAPTDAPTLEAVEDDHESEEHMDEGEEHMDGEHMDEHSPDDHMAGAHDVPEDAAAIPNPFEGDTDSTSQGAQLYAAHCALCHGESGEGDGPASSGLERPPADLHASHVQELSDGALFYIITHGRPDTPMPAWEGILEEEERWHVVNFLRTFN